jgi:hypothetical protein
MSDGWFRIDDPENPPPKDELAEIILFNGFDVCSGSWWEGRWCSWHDEIFPQPTHWRALPPPPVTP